MNTQILMVLDVLAKSLGVLLFAAALQSLWRKSSASRRCLVWLTAFSVLLLLPLTAVMKPVWTVKVPDRATPPPVLHELPMIQSVRVIPDEDLSPAPVAEPAWHMPQLDLWQWLGLAWLTGVTVLLLRRAAGAWQLRRLYKESFACETPRISAVASRLASEVGVRRRVDLRLSSKVTVPLTWGFIKPVLLLPADATEWQEAPLHAALCHELGHIRHWDALSRLLMSVLCALQWPNVPLWLAAKSWRTAQEQACDDLVLNSGASKEAYAMQLLESARSVQRLGFLHAALTMAQPSTLETRLSAIMDMKRDRRPMRRGALLVGLASSVSLLLLCAALQLRAEGPSRAILDAGNLHLTCDNLQFSDLAHQTGKATGHVTLTVTNDGPPPSIKEGKADEVEFDLSKKQATLRGHPETFVVGDHRHYGTADDTKMIIHWDGAKVRQETFGPAKTDILPEASAKVEPLKNAASAESPFNPHVDIIGEQTNFDPVSGIATAKGHAEATFTTNGNPPVIYQCKADALEYDTNKKEVALHGHVEVPDGATGGVVPSDHSDIIIKWNKPKGAWEIRTPKSTDAGGEKLQTPQQTHDWVAESTRKMERIIFPSVQFKENTLEEAIEFLRVKSKDLDTAETRANFKGVNIILIPGTPPPTARITLDLHDVPMVEALHYVTELAGLKYKVEPYAVVVGQEKRLAALGVPIPFDSPVQTPAPATPAMGAFTIVGEVVRQGKYELKPNEPLTVGKAIDRAGGPTAFADMKSVHLIRRQSKEGPRTHDGKDINITTTFSEVPPGQFGFESLVGPGDKIKVDKQGENSNSHPSFPQHPSGPLLAEAGQPVTALVLSGAADISSPLAAKSAAQTKADGIIIPVVLFKEATVEEALDFLRVKGKELDPAKEGVNIVLKVGPKARAKDAKLTMDLKDIPLGEALHYVAELADLELTADDHAMILRERSKNGPAGEQKGKAGAAAAPAKGWFTVFGQVKQQGKFELQPGEKLTLSQALQRAGGPTAFARTRKIHVVRKAPEGNKTINVNYDKVVKGGKAEEDIQIEPNDVIIVDEKLISF